MRFGFRSPKPSVVAIRRISYDQTKMLKFCVENPFYQYHVYGDSILDRIIIPYTPEFLTTYCHDRARRGSKPVKAIFKPLMDLFIVDDDEFVPVSHKGRTEWVKSVKSSN